MKKLMTILICLFTLGVSSQMYVSPNTYVFSNNQFLYVTQHVELNAATSNLYLRNNSQLLQGVNGLGVNRGLGSLSVYQEGTTNNFQYNYWCSPIGVPTATIGNSNFGITRLFRPSVTDKVTSTAATLIAGNDGLATNTSLSIAQRWIWKYLASNIYGPGTGGWVYVGAGSTVESGLGFTMKGTSGTDNLVSDSNDGVQNKPNTNFGQRYDFRGLPNDGNMTAAVSNVNGASYINITLVGNPYPSAINLNYYLLENSGYIVNAVTGVVSGTGVGGQIDNTAYFWEHDKSNNTHIVGAYVGGYGTYVPSMVNVGTVGTYVSAPMSTYSADGESTTAGAASLNDFKRMFTPIGQGFMVHGIVPAGTVTMRNKYRVFVKEGIANNSQFERVANEYWGEIPNVAELDYTLISKTEEEKFKIRTRIDELVVYENALVFGDLATDGYDGFDGICTYSNATKTAYLTTSDLTDKFVISSMPFNINKRVPMVFKTDVPATFKVNVSDLTYFTLADNIYLHDISTGVYHDIKNGYFQMLLPAGEYTNRFEITFQTDYLTNEDFTSDDFQLFAGDNFLYIENGDFLEINSLKIYDVNGKLVLDKNNLGNNNHYRFDLNSFSTGVYIAKVRSGNKNLSLKLIKR